MDREYIINNYSKNEFTQFLSYDNDSKILELLNSEGINILKASSLKEERISYILTYSKYKNELLKNIEFIDLFLTTNISYYSYGLENLEESTYNILIKRCLELNMDSEKIANIFKYFSDEYKLKIIDENILPEEMIYDIFRKEDSLVVQKLIDNNLIDLTNDNIIIDNFFNKAACSVLKARRELNLNDTIIEEITVPSDLITPQLADKLWNNYDIYRVRKIINEAWYCTDATVLNNYVKNKENQLIEQSKDLYLLPPYDELLESYKEYRRIGEFMHGGEIKDEDIDLYYKCTRNCLKIETRLGQKNLLLELNKLYNENELVAVEEYIKLLSDRSLSNYIIDYHFEENYHNIMLDINELLKFYYDGNIAIPSERMYLYDRISNIDYLSKEEKKELHEMLKNINVIELFYDDMALARNIVREAIKEYSLSSSTIKEYKDKELSEKYGVDVYTLDGNPFFGIVKTGFSGHDMLPAGHSYSLIGDGGLSVFGNVEESTTYLYDSDSMKKEQIVHVFPFDSFTFYHPFEGDRSATNRVDKLMMPNELVNFTTSYNELLILEKGIINTDIDSSIPNLKRIALYCLDEIREKDIKVAKANNVGIILVDSRKYIKSNGISAMSSEIMEDNYFDGFYNKDKFEEKRCK